MRSGDLIRFREILEHGSGLHRPTVYSTWKVGLLKEYHTWEKIATILYEGGLLRVTARDVQKFGKRYLKSAEQHQVNR